MAYKVSDEMVATFVPVLVYRVYSGIYVPLGPLDKYQLHSREDEESKNSVPKSTAIKDVLFQQAIQIAIAILVFTTTNKEDKSSLSSQPTFFGQAKQFIVAMLIMDAWQYFVHRYLHANKFLYHHLHSRHHRLVVPYAYGALYTHPLEALLLDNVGGAISFLISGMSPRTSTYFFSLTTIKTVDDHCGMWLPWNPFQMFLSNNTAYHDVHHQMYGSKYNFSQPFFVMWNKILGAYMPYSLEKRRDGGFEARPIKD